MIFALLVCIWVVTLFGRVLGIEGGVTTGLSLKNVLLMLSIFSVIATLPFNRDRLKFPWAVYGSYTLVAIMAAVSITMLSIFLQKEGYSVNAAIVSFKIKLVDPLLMLIIGYFACKSIESAKRLLTIFSMIVVAGCTLTVIDAFGVFNIDGITIREEDGRAEGFVGSAAEFSTIVAATIPIVIFGSLWSNEYRRFFVAFSLILLLTSMLLAATRAPFLGLLICWVIFLFYLSRKSLTSVVGSFTIFASVIMLLFTAVGFSSFGDLIIDRALTGVTSGSINELSSGRATIWKKIIYEMWSQPKTIVIGMGWDVYFQNLGRYATHNVFLDRFYSLGIFGLSASLIAYWYTIKYLLQEPVIKDTPNISLSNAAGLSFVVLAVSAMFADLNLTEFFIYSIAGIGLRCLQLSYDVGSKQIPVS